MDRRTTLKWVLAASAAWPQLGGYAAQAAPMAKFAAGDAAGNAREGARGTAGETAARGYGRDPNLIVHHRPGELWPLTLSEPQRRLASCLADIIIPADEHSPGASAVGVVDFIDEWISAPYPNQQEDRALMLEGIGWMDAEAGRRFARGFTEIDSRQQHAICDDVCDTSRAAAERGEAARFFALFRDLTGGGFYSSEAGRKDLGYIGNVPQLKFEGPPSELLKALGLVE